MNDASSRAFVNDPVSSGIPNIREQNSVANSNSEEEHETSITPSATSNSGDEGSDKAMESNNNNITSNGNGAQHQTDSPNSHNQQHMMGEASPLQSAFMSAGEADERQALGIADMETIQDSSNHPSHPSSNNMSAGEADERQAIVDLEIQDSSSGSDEAEVIDQDEINVYDKFGSVGLADSGGEPVQEHQQQQQQPVNTMDPIPVDLAQASTAQQQVEPAAAARAPAAADEVIELLDDDEDNDAASDNTDDLITKALTSDLNGAKRQKMSGDENNGNQAAQPSYSNPYEQTAQQQPYQQPPYESQWTQGTPSRRHGPAAPIQPGQSLNLPANAQTDSAARASHAIQQAYGAPVSQQPPGHHHQPMPPQPSSYSAPPRSSLTPKVFQTNFKYDEPQYIPLPDGFVPNWNELVPAKPKPVPQQQYQHRSNERKYFQLSLLNVNDFTITGLPISFDGPPTSISGMRVPIRQVSREHGKAVYERDKEGGPGKWRIPLGAYQAFFAYLRSDPNCRVEGISSIQLKVASLERARQEKGYPSVEKLVEAGVPNGLAKTLAPFQRGGVDFVLEKKGRALIADGTYVLVVNYLSPRRVESPIP
jgi:hypothetical protein